MMPNDPLFLIAVNLFVAVLVRIMKPNLLTGALFAVVVIVSSGYLGTQHATDIARAYYQVRSAALTFAGDPPAWPPRKHETYPDLELLDQTGRRTRLSDFRGKVILVEPVGLSCRACIAFAGGAERGAFRGVEPQSNLDSLENYARRFGRFRLDDPDLVYVQLILFDEALEPPTAEDVREWAEHFGMKREENRIVLAGNLPLASRASRDLIPGFHLIDRDFVLHMSSTGGRPEDDLYQELLPEVRRLLKAPAAVEVTRAGP